MYILIFKNKSHPNSYFDLLFNRDSNSTQQIQNNWLTTVGFGFQIIVEIIKKLQNDVKTTITRLIKLPAVGPPKKAGINVFSKSNCIINNHALWQAQYVLKKNYDGL